MIQENRIGKFYPSAAAVAFSEEIEEEHKLFPERSTEPSNTKISPEGAIELLNLKLRVAELEGRVDDLQHIAESRPIIAQVADLPSLRLIRPIMAVIERSADEEYVAMFLDANINASGDTQHEAFQNLREMIASTYRLFIRKENQLGDDPHRQLAVLRTYIEG